MNTILENKILLVVLVVASIQLGSWCSTAQADPIIDQQQTEWSSILFNKSEPYWYRDIAGSHDGYFGQSFTAGASGLLTKIEVNINSIYRGGADNKETFNSPPTLKIYEGHFVPSGTYGDLLYSGPVDLTAVPSAWVSQHPEQGPTWYTLDLVSPLLLTEGGQYTFIVNGPEQIQHLINKLNPYLGGCFFAVAHVFPDWDILFKTWVEITASNTPPTVDAGGPYLVAVGQEIMFDGSGSYDPDGDVLTELLQN